MAKGKKTQAMVYVTGVKELDALLRQLPDNLGKKLLRTSLRKAAKPVYEIIRNEAPKDEGDYYKTIRIGAAKRSRKNKHRMVIQVRTDVKRLEEIAEQQGQVFNPHWLEYGTEDTGQRPHFRIGVDRGASLVRNVFLEELGPRLDEAVRELRSAAGVA